MTTKQSSFSLGRYYYWRSIMKKLWVTVVVIALGLAGFRLALYCAYAPVPLNVSNEDVWLSFWMGMRFDIKLMATWAALLFLLSLVCYCLPRCCMRLLDRFSLHWLMIGVLIIYLLSLVNHFYFAFYQSPINPIIFGFFEDDTNAIIETLWSDYPVVWCVLFLCVLCYAHYVIVHKVCLCYAVSSKSKPIWVVACVVCMNVVAFTAVVRGGFGVFPLRSDGVEVSRNSFINQIVLPGGQALYFAWKDRKSNRIDSNVLKGLQALGYDDAESALQYLSTSQTPEEYLWVQTPVNEAVEHKSPHVVVSVMESWGRHLLDFDKPARNDLLGKLRPWVEGKADYFDNALSYQNGTHPSLEGIILDTPITPLTQAYGYQTFNESVALPYKKAGYRTIFIYAGSLHWRRLGQVLPQQGFDELYGAAAIQSRIPDAEYLSWGVQDEYMFDFAKTLFDDKDTRPIFMVMLSSTNHPPYYPPAEDVLEPTDVNTFGDVEFSSSPEIMKKVLKTYQYANSQLGEFYDFLERTGRLEYTLFAATGDHNTHSAFIYPDSRLLGKKYGVPILMRIPKEYRRGDNADIHQWAAHQDIMSTLFYYSLSDTRVPRLGRNLYQQNFDAYAFSFTEGGALISESGAVVNMFSPRYYHWSSDGRYLEPVTAPNDSLDKVFHTAKAWYGLRDWRIRKQIVQP